MPEWKFELSNYDDNGIKCTDGSKNYLVFFEAKCTGVAEGHWKGPRDELEFDIRDAYCDNFELLSCEAVLDDEEAEDKLGWNADYVFVDDVHKITLDNCDPEAKEMWKKLKTEDGLSITEVIGALADDYAYDTAGDEDFIDDYDSMDDNDYDRYRDDRW